MLLNFIKVDFRTKVLVEKYTELISAGVKPSEIPVSYTHLRAHET